MIEKNLPTRKRNRLEHFDYSTCKGYFITICTKDRKNLFWVSKQPDFMGQATPILVGEDSILPPVNVQLSTIGKIVNEAILSIPVYYPNIELLQYVIMPNHIHMILMIPYDGRNLTYDPEEDLVEAGGRMLSSPTSKGAIITSVGQMKRHVSRKLGMQIWQRSFHDHIIRNREDYEQIAKYIYENPARWQFDCFYVEDNA